jgi:hypothetical protein
VEVEVEVSVLTGELCVASKATGGEWAMGELRKPVRAMDLSGWGNWMTPCRLAGSAPRVNRQFFGKPPTGTFCGSRFRIITVTVYVTRKGGWVDTKNEKIPEELLWSRGAYSLRMAHVGERSAAMHSHYNCCSAPQRRHDLRIFSIPY